jgi:hypothetical protein
MTVSLAGRDDSVFLSVTGSSAQRGSPKNSASGSQKFLRPQRMLRHDMGFAIATRMIPEN